MHSRVILKLFENYKCPSIAIFFSRVPDVFKEQSCFTGLYDDLLLISNLFHFFYFIFSAPISFSLCFPIFPFLFFMFFIKPLPSIVEKLSYQIRSVAQSCPTLCDPMNRSTPGLPVHHQLLGLTQAHIHRVSDAIQPSHPLSSPSPPSPNPSQHQSLFQ